MAKKLNEAYHELRADNALTPDEKNSSSSAVNAGYLFAQDREWGNRGIKRSFRFWTDKRRPSTSSGRWRSPTS